MLLLYNIGMTLTNNGFLYQDLVAIIPFAILQSLTPAYHKLSKELPNESMFSPPEWLSLSLQISVMWAFQLFVYKTVKK